MLPVPRSCAFLLLQYKRATDPAKKREALAAFQAQHAFRQTVSLEVGRFSTALAQALPPLVTAAAREPDAPLVDDWMCLRETVSEALGLWAWDGRASFFLAPAVEYLMSLPPLASTQ